jgi:hypothetical protein
MLRTHRSLKAYCATLWWKWKMISFFFIFTGNVAPLELNWQGKTEVLGGKTCPSATLSTTNPTWSVVESNPGLRGERPATDRLSYGTADCSYCSAVLQDDTNKPAVTCQIPTVELPSVVAKTKDLNFCLCNGNIMFSYTGVTVSSLGK